MAKKIEVEVEEGKKEEGKKERLSGILELSRKMLMAAIGAAVVAEEEITNFVDRLVERGEIAEQDARRLITDVLEKREKIARDKLAEIRSKRPITVATKADIEALNEKIAELSKKIEELKAA